MPAIRTAVAISFFLALAAGCQHTTVVRVPEPVPPRAEPTALAPEPAPPRTAEEIAKTDNVMQQYLAARANLQAQLNRLRSTGLLDAHPDVVRVRTQLERTDELIAQRRAEVDEVMTRRLSEQTDLRRAELRRVLGGTVDLYLDPSELSARKPSIERAQFVDEVDVGGRRMFKFTRASGESWLVDPARIVAVRSAQ